MPFHKVSIIINNDSLCIFLEIEWVHAISFILLPIKLYGFILLYRSDTENIKLMEWISTTTNWLTIDQIHWVRNSTPWTAQRYWGWVHSFFCHFIMSISQIYIFSTILRKTVNLYLTVYVRQFWIPRDCLQETNHKCWHRNVQICTRFDDGIVIQMA